MKKKGLLFLGLIEGLLSGALGIGGGVLIVPTLNLVFGFDIKKAAGTSLAAIVPIATLSLLAHAVIDSSHILFSYALLIMLGALMGTWVGTSLEHHLKGAIVIKFFAAFLAFAGINMFGLFKATIFAVQVHPVSLIALGILVGVVSSMFGVGGGIILVPALTLLFGLPIVETVATSLLVIVPTAIAGTIFHKIDHDIDFHAVGLIVPLAIIGAIVGAVLANALPAQLLRFIFGVMVVFTAVKMYIHVEPEKTALVS